MGVNLINVNDCFANDCAGENRSDDKRGSRDRGIPSHEERLSELHRLGVKIGLDCLNQAQAEKLIV